MGLELWVECMGPDTDVFAYLEDVDALGNIRWVLLSGLQLCLYLA